MGKRKKSPKEELNEMIIGCYKSYNIWRKQRAEGVNDPFWSDGFNLNLIRNHITYYKKQIRKICAENNFILPAIILRPLPVKKDNKFMVNGKPHPVDN